MKKVLLLLISTVAVAMQGMQFSVRPQFKSLKMHCAHIVCDHHQTINDQHAIATFPHDLQHALECAHLMRNLPTDALVYAVCNGVNCIDDVIARGALINCSCDIDGNTPLMHAIMNLEK